MGSPSSCHSGAGARANGLQKGVNARGSKRHGQEVHGKQDTSWCGAGCGPEASSLGPLGLDGWPMQRLLSGTSPNVFGCGRLDNCIRWIPGAIRTTYAVRNGTCTLHRRQPDNGRIQLIQRPPSDCLLSKGARSNHIVSIAPPQLRNSCSSSTCSITDNGGHPKCPHTFTPGRQWKRENKLLEFARWGRPSDFTCLACTPSSSWPPPPPLSRGPCSGPGPAGKSLASSAQHHPQKVAPHEKHSE